MNQTSPEDYISQLDRERFERGTHCLCDRPVWAQQLKPYYVPSFVYSPVSPSSAGHGAPSPTHSSSSAAASTYADHLENHTDRLSAAVTATLTRARPSPTRALPVPASSASVYLSRRANMSPLHQHVKDVSDKLSESIEQGKESMLDAYAATSPAHAALLCRVSGRQLRDKTNETLFHSVRDSNAENSYTDRPPLVSSQEPDLAVRISIPRLNTTEKTDRTRHTRHNYQPGDSLAVSRNLRRGTALHGFQRDAVAGDRFDIQTHAVDPTSPDKVPYGDTWKAMTSGSFTAAYCQAQEIGRVQLQLLERRRRGRYMESDMNLAFALNPYGPDDSPYPIF